MSPEKIDPCPRPATTPDPAPQGRRLTVPNVLCLVRLAGSVGLVPLALADRPFAFLVLFLVFTATDWLDGKLAVWLDQRSDFGARLDSVADATLYAVLLFGGSWLKRQAVSAELVWIVPAILSYALSCAVSLLRFRRLPSYHTRSAKTAWLLILIAAVSLLLDGSAWPLRIAMIGVLIANSEAILLTLVLRDWRTDISFFWQAWPRR